MSNQIVRLVGTFTGSERNELLFHYPESGEWWLGYFSNNQLHWQLANNSSALAMSPTVALSGQAISQAQVGQIYFSSLPWTNIGG